MTTNNKDFKVKNGIAVTDGGTFGGPVTVGEPTDPSHAATKAYIDELTALIGIDTLDGGSPETGVWGNDIDGGTP